MNDNPGGGCLGTLIWLFCIGLLIAGCNAVVANFDHDDAGCPHPVFEQNAGYCA